MGRLTPVIRVLILINVALFAVTYLIPKMDTVMLRWFALYFPDNQYFGVWQFITHMFMHGSLAHIILNMYALWAFGTPLEMMWGKNRFLLFYFVVGIGAGAIYTVVNMVQFNQMYQELVSLGVSAENITHLLETGQYSSTLLESISEEDLESIFHLYNSQAVGASGAIYGVLVAFGILFPNAKLALLFFPVPIAAKYFIPALIAIDLFSGVTGVSLFGGGIAHFAHVGGALIGFLMMWYWKNKGVNRYHRM